MCVCIYTYTHIRNTYTYTDTDYLAKCVIGRVNEYKYAWHIEGSEYKYVERMCVCVCKLGGSISDPYNSTTEVGKQMVESWHFMLATII